MAKKTNTSPASESQETAAHVGDEDRAYALKVIAKQAAVGADQAEQIAGQLSADELAELVRSGRNGEVARCRELLQL